MPDDGATRPAGDPNLRFDAAVASAALAGLLAARKTLPPRLFYDEAGCRLFGAITRLAEYYPTRTEMALLPAVAADIATFTQRGSTLVEYGASDEAKANFLLDAGEFAAYVPIDVARLSLNRLQARMAADRPGLRVVPIAADFLRPIELPAIELPAGIEDSPRLGFFPGSTIGNLDPTQARELLDEVRVTLGPRARFLVGVDLRKDPAILLPAYDDAAGVTAAFNRNLLVRLNREADADFEIESFSHQARWNDGESRIEMHLVSRIAQAVRVADHVIRFDRGESIHTENSYKFTVSGLSGLSATAGWHLTRSWTDPAGLFSVVLLEQTGS